MVTDIPCSPKKLAFKNEVENNDSESVLENKGRSDSDIKDNCLEVESSAQHSTTNLPQRVSHSVSTGEVKLTPYKIAAVCAICFIIGCFTLPIIFYYVNDGERIDTEEVCLLVTGINVCVYLIFSQGENVLSLVYVEFFSKTVPVVVSAKETISYLYSVVPVFSTKAN